MNLHQHLKLAHYYRTRHAQMAALSREQGLNHQQAVDYHAIFRKYLTHKQAAAALARANERRVL